MCWFPSNNKPMRLNCPVSSSKAQRCQRCPDTEMPHVRCSLKIMVLPPRTKEITPQGGHPRGGLRLPATLVTTRRTPGIQLATPAPTPLEDVLQHLMAAEGPGTLGCLNAKPKDGGLVLGSIRFFVERNSSPFRLVLKKKKNGGTLQSSTQLRLLAAPKKETPGPSKNLAPHKLPLFRGAMLICRGRVYLAAKNR